MSTQSDEDLLREYISSGESRILAELITRYAPMVYAAARRQVRDADLAEDVMQNVFIIFAKKIRGIRSGAAIGAWLMKTTRYAAANAMKIQARRRRHERAAATTHQESIVEADSIEQWQTIEPLMDRALSRLAWADQTAVVLRFFRGLSMREIADAMGTTEEAVRKRIGRAIERLRKQLLAAGAQSGGFADASLIAFLSSRASEPVPAHLLAQTTSAAASAAKVASGSILFGAIAMTTTGKIVSGLVLIAIVIATSIGVITQIDHAHPSQQATIVSAATPQPAPLTDYDAKPFFAVYALRPGEYIKIIPPPFIAQRWPPIWMANYGEIEPRINEDPVVDCLFIKQFPDGTMKPFEGEDSGSHGSGLPGLTVRELALQCPGPHLGRVRPWQIEGDPILLATCLPGDVVIRDGATTEQMLQGIQDALSIKLGRKIAFTNDHPRRDVVVVTGTSSEERIHLRIPASLNTGRAVFPTRGSSQFNRVLDYLTDITGQLFLDQTQNGISSVNGNNGPVIYSWNAEPADNNDESADAGLVDLLKSLSNQTGLTFKHEIRPVDVWKLAPVSAQ